MGAALGVALASEARRRFKNAAEDNAGALFEAAERELTQKSQQATPSKCFFEALATHTARFSGLGGNGRRETVP